MTTHRDKLVHLQEDCTTKDGIFVPEGSGIHVESVTRKTITGIWSSYMGSYSVTVPRKSTNLDS